MRETVKRDIGIDLLKVFAIFGVLIIHTCSYNAPIGTFNWYGSLFWGSLSRASVPIFLMTSGAMMLSKDYTLKKLFTKNILRILIAMFFWAILYKAFHLHMDSNLTKDTFIHGIKEVFLFNQEFHFYYLHMILIVYLFLPITRIIVKNATKKQMQYLLGIWFFLAIFLPTAMPYKPLNMMGIRGMWPIGITYASIGYGILGYYIKKHPIPRMISIILILAGFSVIFFGTSYMSLKYNMLYEHFLSGTGIGAFAMAVGIFGFLSRVNVKNKGIEKTAIGVSKASFLVYLVHVFFLIIMKEVGITVGFCPYVISIPVLSLVNLAASLAVYAILSRIPVLRNWVI